MWHATRWVCPNRTRRTVRDPACDCISCTDTSSTNCYCCMSVCVLTQPVQTITVACQFVYWHSQCKLLLLHVSSCTDTVSAYRCCCMSVPIAVVQRVQNQLNAMQWEVLQHPAYSLDLLPCDFCICKPLKTALEGHIFMSDDDEQTVSLGTYI